MEPSISPLRPERSRVGFVLCCAFAAVVLWDSTAFAVNALVSQDLPILVEIASTELASYGQLGSILAEAAAIVASVKEYTDIAKTAWGAVEELRHMTWDDLANAAKEGVGNAFPEFAQISRDLDDIRDLNRRDARATETLRGMLWEYAYGPGIDYLHSGHENLEVLAGMADLRDRHGRILTVRRAEAEGWEDDCRRTGKDGEGACQAGANRAAIQSAVTLNNLHEVGLHSLQAQERLIANDDRRELDTLYAYDRFLYDTRNYLAAGAAGDDGCSPGRCLHDRYADRTWEKVAEFRARHPSRNGLLITSPSREEPAAPTLSLGARR